MRQRAADLAGCGLGYLVGSIPFGVWLGRAVGGLDVREHGSGSMGMTNVLRTVGPAAAGAVFLLDVGKGSAAVTIARRMSASPEGRAAAGLAAAVGHSWPAFARFRGGKSVATAFGGLLVLSPPGSACAVAGGVTALGVTRIVSVGSLAAATSALAGATAAAVRGGGDRRAALVFTSGVSALIFWRHAANIDRLLRGQEPRLTMPGSRARAAATAVSPPQRPGSEGG